MLNNWQKILIIPLILVFPVVLIAQSKEFLRWGDYAVFQEDYRIDSNLHDQFYIRFKNANFFKNNEYANEFKIGSSLTGLFLEPTIDYYASHKTRIRAGVHFLKYYGRDEIDRVAPVLTVQHALNENVNMIFGTIFGTANHGLKEPIFGFEKYLIENYENGIQFLLDYPDMIGDIWLNWEQFIKEGDPFQEKFTAGLNMYFDLYKGSQFRLGIPFQALFRHRGGQIDRTTLLAGTQSNFLQGIKMQWIGNDHFIKHLSFEQDWCQFLEINPGNHLQITEGYANYSIAKLGAGNWEFSVGYWKSRDFSAPHGEGLFLSQSAYQPDFYMPGREVLSIKYQYQYKINNFLDFVFRIEPYYHFHSGRIDHAFSVLLLVDKNFFLAKALSSHPVSY